MLKCFPILFSSDDQLFLRVTIAVSSPLIVVSEVVGWIYFAAWSVSFYPQIIINFRRRSVVGYSFDYASLNVVGFVMYSAFNCALFWNKHIQVWLDEFFSSISVNAIRLLCLG